MVHPDPIVPATTYVELCEHADLIAAGKAGDRLRKLVGLGVRILTASGDVHEYGKGLLDMVFERCDLTVRDGGISTEMENLAAMARESDVIALSIWNGVALRSARKLLQDLKCVAWTAQCLSVGEGTKFLKTAIPVYQWMSRMH